MTGFYASDKIVNNSAYMRANYINLYSFESPEPTLSERKKIIQIESVHVKLFTIKVRN
jgi:hypothetical protein